VISLTTLFIITQTLLVSAGLIGSAMLVKKYKKTLFVVTPLLLAAAISLTVTLKEIQSRPIQGYPELEFVLVDYVQDGDNIFLWAIEESREFPRTWIFPFSNEMEESLRDLKEKGEEGIPVQAEYQEGTMNGNGSMVVTGSPRSMLGDTTGGKEGFGKL